MIKAWAMTVLLIFTAGCQPRVGQETLAGKATRASDSIPQALPFIGVIVSADQVTDTNLTHWQTDEVCVALVLTNDSNNKIENQAAQSIVEAGLVLDYFVQVGRCREMAEAHPEWMASLQGHQQWRKRFPETAKPTNRQVIKNYPWVPILYQESFEAHLDRIRQLLVRKPTPRRIWLADLQGAPSACGCGHPLCRWTADYGPIKTATPLDDHAAAKFVDGVEAIAKGIEIIPIFVGECEAEDKDTVCCGVACFEGKCWKDFTRQLDAVAANSDRVGVACFYQLFERDLDRYGPEAGWVSFTLDSFSKMPRLRGGHGVTPDRLVAVLQGWDVTQSQIESQIEQAKKAHVAGWLVAMTPLNQSWRPVVYDLPAENDAAASEANGHDQHQN